MVAFHRHSYALGSNDSSNDYQPEKKIAEKRHQVRRHFTVALFFNGPKKGKLLFLCESCSAPPKSISRRARGITEFVLYLIGLHVEHRQKQIYLGLEKYIVFRRPIDDRKHVIINT